MTRDDYVLLGFTDDFGAALAAATLVVARAGGSVWEVAAAGKPALLVPYPSATADHQTKNARFFEQAGGAIVVPEERLELARAGDGAARGSRPARGDGRGDARARAPRRGRRDRRGGARACPLEGRKLWLAGIGGSGLSAYALVARGWGAEVAGWDRKETPYLAPVREAGIDVTVSDEPPPAPDGFDVVVSTAYAGRIAGRPRAELLAELAAQAPTIVVSGAHGKTTTAAMIAFVLDRLGLDPAFAIGGEVPQLGANARAGSGWFVVEGDESDRTVASLPARIAVITNVDLDHHTTFGSRAEVEELYAGWLAGLPDVQVVRGDALEPVDLPLAVPGEHNRRNAAAALAALELAGVVARRGRSGDRRVPRRRSPARTARRGRWSAGARRLRPPSGGAGRHHRGRARADRRPPRRPLPAASLLADALPGARVRRRARRRRRRLHHRHLRRARGADPRRDREARSSSVSASAVQGCRWAGRRPPPTRFRSSPRRPGRAGSSSPRARETSTPWCRQILEALR